MAHQNIGTLVLLPGGTVYARTLKHYLVVSVQENYLYILVHHAKNGKDCPLAARHSSPALKGWALRRELVNEAWKKRLLFQARSFRFFSSGSTPGLAYIGHTVNQATDSVPDSLKRTWRPAREPTWTQHNVWLFRFA